MARARIALAGCGYVGKYCRACRGAGGGGQKQVGRRQSDIL